MCCQLKNISAWANRKAILLGVWLVSTAIPGFLMYGFAQQGNWTGFSATGTAFLLAGSVYLLLLKEIQNRKKLLERLRTQKEHYRITISSMAEGLITTGSQGEIRYMNPAAERMTGWTLDETKNLPLQTVYNVVNEETGKPLEHIVNRILRNRKKVEFENNTVLYTKAKSKLIISNGGSPLFDNNGNIAGAVIVFNDISEKKEKEVLIKQSEEKYRSLFEEASDAILIHSFDGTIHEFNKSCYTLLGYSKEEYSHLKLTDILVEDIIVNQANYAAILAGETRTVYRHLKRKDGSVIEAEVTVKLLADGKVISFTRDITERRKTEEAIRKEKNLLKTVINSLPGIFYLLDENLSFLRWNKNFETVSGYNAHEIADMDPLDFFDEDEKQFVAEKIREIMTKGEVYTYASFYTKDRKKVPYYFSGFKMKNEGEIQVAGMGLDITELKNAETKMKTAIERYDILARATSDTIWDWDMVNNKMLYNEGINKMFGYHSSEVENIIDWWNEKIHPDDFYKLTELLDDIYKKGPRRFQLTYRFRCADGSYKYIYDRAFVIYNADRRPVRIIGAMQDITSAKEEEKRIAKAIIDAQEQERRVIGQELHDNVNQILASSLLIMDMAKNSLADQERAVEYTSLSIEYTMKAINEIRKLSHELAPATFDDNTLKDIFDNLLNSINLDNRYVIRFHFDERINKAAGDYIQINLYRILQEQVKNILKYAEANTLEVEVTQSGSVVRMRIYDNGKGFDTRSAKMGIGISNMKKRTEALDGKFIFNTQPGRGCEIVVEVPLSAHCLQDGTG